MDSDKSRGAPTGLPPSGGSTVRFRRIDPDPLMLPIFAWADLLDWQDDGERDSFERLAADFDARLQWLRRNTKRRELPGGYRCEKCRATGPYPVDDTTPRHAFRIVFESCPECDPTGEDAFRYIDTSGRTLTLDPSNIPDDTRGK